MSSLRLVLSNKIRSKIIRDLVNTDNEQTKTNVQNILEREDEGEWLGEFQELREDIERKEREKRKKHNKQLVSRSTYNNAYYQFMALEKEQKQQYLRREKKHSNKKGENVTFFEAVTETEAYPTDSQRKHTSIE